MLSLRKNSVGPVITPPGGLWGPSGPGVGGVLGGITGVITGITAGNSAGQSAGVADGLFAIGAVIAGSKAFKKRLSLTEFGSKF